MKIDALRRIVYSIFSDTLMVFLAILVIPIVVAQYLFDLTSTQNLIVIVADWLIYTAFFAEFILKVAVAKDKANYVKTNKLYTLISLIIILSPLLETLSALFAAAPLLRAFRIVVALRLSRLTRLAAASGRARIAWKRIKFRTYAIVTAVIVFGFFISFFKPDLRISANDQNSFSQFIQIAGTIYAIITGFIVASVWNKYTALVNATRQEPTSLRNVYLLVTQLKNRQLINILKENLLHYTNAVIDVYWKGINQISLIEDKAVDVFLSIDGYSTRTAEEIEIFTNCIDELRRSAESRIRIQALLASKTPNILWALLVVLSSILFLGFYLTSYDNQLLSTLTLTVVSTAVALVAVIIYDMDDPFKFGFWAVSPKSYLELITFLEETKH